MPLTFPNCASTNSGIKNGASDPASCRLLLLDDHSVILEGLESLLSHQSDFHVVGKVTSRTELLQWCEAGRADLLILDLLLEGENGFDLIKEVRLKRPALKILVFSMYSGSDLVSRALDAGASGYCVKGDDVSFLLEGARSVRDTRKPYLSPSAAKISGTRSEGLIDSTDLSTRELEVFRLVGEGMKTKEIAKALGVSVKTIESHRDNIKRKLHLEHSEKLQVAAALWRAQFFRVPPLEIP